MSGGAAEGASGEEVGVYLARIEDRFRRLRGTPLLVSPRDWALMLEWWQTGIPAPVVEEALEETFSSAGDRRVRSLAYCRSAVERAWKRYRDARLGRRGEPRPEEASLAADARALVDAARTAVEATMRGGAAEPWHAVHERLSALAEELARSELASATIERELAATDDALVEAAEAALDGADREALLAAAREQLEPYRSRMSESAYARTVRHAFTRALRDRFGLPRLSLV